MTEHSFDTRLKTAATLLHLSLSDLTSERLLAFLKLLGQWNQTYNLTAIRQPSEQLIQHIFDSLAVVPYLNQLMVNQAETPSFATRPLDAIVPNMDPAEQNSRNHQPHPTGNEPKNAVRSNTDSQQVWDIGSGAGIPGLMLAMLWPDRQITTVESVGKKVAFQKHVIAELGLKNVRAVHGRIEQQAAQLKPDLIICRAFTSLAQFIESSRSVAGTTTVLAAMKGKLPGSEIKEIPPDWQVGHIVPIKVPELEAERHLIIINRN